MVDTVAAKSFAEILSCVRDDIGEDRYELWFKSARLLKFFRGTMTIGVPNVFFRDWINEHYAGSLARIARDVVGTEVKFELKVDPELFREHRRNIADAALDETLEIESAGEPASSLDDMIVVPENEFAVRTVRHVVDGAEPRFNPLLLVGPAGCGKTHLLSAFGQPGADGAAHRTLCMGALDFTSRFTMSLKMRAVDEFRAGFDGYDVVAFDEIHRLKGKKATQKELLQLVTRLTQSGTQVVMAGRYHPKEIHDINRTLQSILLSGMMVQLEAYSPASLVQIVRHGLGPRREASREVIQRLARSCRGNVRELKTKLLRVYAYAGLLGEEVTTAFVDEHLGELSGAPRGEPDHDAVVDSVCGIFGVTREDLLSKRKVKSLILPRAVAACVLRDRYRITFKEIGRILGGRSHTSIYLMYSKYLPVICADEELKEIVARIPRAGAEADPS